jgi:hypothetical protein
VLDCRYDNEPPHRGPDPRPLPAGMLRVWPHAVLVQRPPLSPPRPAPPGAGRQPSRKDRTVSTTAAIVKRQAAAKNYREGYQHALADVLTALEDGGEDAARAWIADNYRETEAGRP